MAAVRDVTRARIVFNAGLRGDEDRLRIVQAPIFVHRAGRPSQSPRTLTDIFADIGFRQVSLVQPLLLAWASVLNEVRPQVLLADTAPGLLAANQGRIPTVVIGNGWTVPPDISPTPAFDEAGWDPQRTVLAETEILTAIKMSGFRPPRAISQLTHGHATFVFTPKEIDPYRENRSASVRFPPNVKLDDKAARRNGSGCTIYLPPAHPAIQPVLKALEKNDLCGRAYFGEQGVSSSSRKVRVSAQPLNLKVCLPASKFMIHHGGLGIASWCVAYGLPQLVIPLDAEKRSISKRVMDIGLGITVDSPSSILPALSNIADRQKSFLYSNKSIDAKNTLSMVVAKITSYR